MKFHVYYRVTTSGRKRFETVYLEAAQEFVRSIYKAEGVIAVIDEVRR